jgi:hypothetical protein
MLARPCGAHRRLTLATLKRSLGNVWRAAGWLLKSALPSGERDRDPNFRTLPGSGVNHEFSPDFPDALSHAFEAVMAAGASRCEVKADTVISQVGLAAVGGCAERQMQFSGARVAHGVQYPLTQREI